MPGRISETVISDIKNKVNLVTVVGRYVELKKKGHQWWGRCPFHNEKTPSFTVDEEKGVYYCFGCQKGGGIFQFLMDVEALTFSEAVHRLADITGVEITDTRVNEKENQDRRVLEEIYKRISQTFHWLLLHHEEAAPVREYAAKRGISKETLENYGLGWAPLDGTWLYQFLSKNNYSPEILAKTGFFSRRSPQWSLFINRLMFPVMPDSGKVVAFSGRALDDHGPKYINSPETLLYVKKRTLYGLAQARQTIREERRAVLCEGNFDVLSCVQAGIKGTVSPLGTSFTEEQAVLLSRMADEIILMFDGDDAGRKAVLKAAVIAEKAGLTVKAVLMPQGEDPSNILVKNGPEKLKKIVNMSVSIWKFLIQFEFGGVSDVSGDQGERVFEELMPYLNAVESDIRRETYLRELAISMGKSLEAVLNEYNRKRRQNPGQPGGSRRVQNNAQNPVGEQSFGDELYLMTAVAVNPEYFKILQTSLPSGMLRDERALYLHRIMDELSARNAEFDTGAVIAALDEGSDLAAYIAEASATWLSGDDPDGEPVAGKTVKEKIQSIKLQFLSNERKELTSSMIRNQGMAEDNKARLRRIQEIDKEITLTRQGYNG